MLGNQLGSVEQLLEQLNAREPAAKCEQLLEQLNAREPAAKCGAVVQRNYKSAA